MLRKLAVTLLATILPAQVLAQTPSLSDLLETTRSDTKLIGLASVVMQDGEIVEQAAVGLRQKSGEDALQIDDLFHVGSIGKSMSATAIARLVERGEIGWNDRLGDVAPDLASEVDPGWHDLTLDMLLSHRSGLPQMGIRQIFQGDDEQTPLPEMRRTILSQIMDEPPDGPIGSSFEYNNAGYALASLIVEEATGRVWEDILIEELAQPLGLDSLGFGAPAGEDSPWGHRKLLWFKIAMSPSGNSDNPPFMSAAGTMHLTLQDLVSYGHAHISRDPALLSEESYERLQTPQLNDYGYGWVIVDERDWAGGPAIWHNGSNTMWYALLAMAPEKDLVIAIATNDGDLKKARPAFNDLIREIGERYPLTDEISEQDPTP